MGKLYAALCSHETVHVKDKTRVRFMLRVCDHDEAVKLIHFSDDENQAKAEDFVKRAEMGVIVKIHMKHYYAHSTEETWIILSNNPRHMTPREHIALFLIEFDGQDVVPAPRHPEGGPIGCPHPGHLEGYEEGYITNLPE